MYPCSTYQLGFLNAKRFVWSDPKHFFQYLSVKMWPHLLIKGSSHSMKLKYLPTSTLVSFPDSTTHARRGSGDIGADYWFCKLSNHVIICIDLYWRSCSHVMVRKTKKTLQCPQTLSLLRVGSGNETTSTRVF